MNYNEFLDSLSSSYKNLLSRLTSASSEPPPGYLYNELVEFVKSNPSKLNEIEEYLINKLSRKEPYVKLKCLKLLKHLCIKFPKDFIRPKVTQSNLVLECKSFKSPHSEYLGDNLTKLVRTECEELIKVVCSYDNNNNFVQSENKMVGFGNNQYNNYNQPGSYTSPGMNNPNYQNQNYNTYQNRNQGVYGPNQGMMGFGNPNMPPTQNTNTSGFASFASTFTPTVSEIKNAGNNALKMLSNAANKYLSSDFVEKIEKVSSAITTTATEQFEKYLGNRSPLGRNDPRNLNNSMYSNRGGNGPNQGMMGFGNPNMPPTQNTNTSGYNPSQGYASGGYNSTAYNAPMYSNPQMYVQPPQPYSNQIPYTSSQNYTNVQAFATKQPVSSSPSFSNSRNTSVSSSYNQGFGAFPAQPRPVHQTSVSNLSHTSSVGTFNPPREPSLDLFSTYEPVSKYTMPGERETAFVREMLTFTGIKVSPSPRLIEEYMVKMKDMDKGLVVSELVKQLNVRSVKWQTHFRILCLLESLVLKGNLDEKILNELKKTGAPIINKCKDEAQLANKATKLVSLLSNSNVMSSEEPSDQVTDLFSAQSTDLFATKDDDLTYLNLSTSVQGTDTVNKVQHDPVDPKVNEFDLFFNTSDVQVLSQTQTTVQQPLVQPSGLVNTSTGNQTPYTSSQNYTGGSLGFDSTVKKDEHNKVDFFDFDNLAFEKPSNSNNTATVQRVVDPALQPVVSNIDNNLDLFDNTDFTNFLDKNTDEMFMNTRNNKSNNSSSSLDLI